MARSPFLALHVLFLLPLCSRGRLLNVRHLCSLLVQMSQCLLNVVSSSPCYALRLRGFFMLSISSLDMYFVMTIPIPTNCTHTLKRSHPSLAASHYLYSAEQKYPLLLPRCAPLFWRVTSLPQRVLHLSFLDVRALRVNPC